MVHASGGARAVVPAHPMVLAMLALLALAGWVRPAQAQVPEARGFLSVGGGIQSAAQDFSQRTAFSHALFGPEEGSFEADYPLADDTLFDAAAGVRVWRYLAVGAGVSRASRETDASIAARLPHPFWFDRPRAISGSAAGLARAETALHVQAQVMIPVARSFTVTLFGGPTWFNVTQDLVTGVNFDQAYPYGSASFSGAVTAEQSASAIGAHVGADAAYYFSSAVGVGATVRYSRGAVEFEAPDGGVIESTAGGVQTSGGLRIRF